MITTDPKQPFPSFYTTDSRYPYPLELMITGANFLFNTRAKNDFQEPIRSLIVYGFADLGDSFLPLGRDYKPLGLTGYNGWVRYQDYSWLCIPKEDIQVAHLKEYLSLSDPLSKIYYLFSDYTYPQNARLKVRYLAQLACCFVKKYREFPQRLFQVTGVKFDVQPPISSDQRGN